MAANAVTRARPPNETIESDGKPSHLSCFLVALSSFSCMAICYGNALTAPMYLVSISTSLDVTQNVAAFPGALVAGVALFSGPFASISVALFGFRIVTITGGIIGALGYFTAYFSKDFITLCISHGVVAGIGLGFINQSSMVVINFYFTKWRCLVSCLCLCGCSVGSMIFPMVFKRYLDDTREGLEQKDKNENWRIYLVIQGGTVLLCCIFGMAYAPVKLWMENRRSVLSLYDPNISPIQSQRESAENIRMRNQTDMRQRTNGPRYNEAKKNLGKCCKNLKRQLGEHMDVGLFKSPTFILFTLSFFIRGFVVNVPSTYITERFKLIDPDDWMSDYALTVMGLSSMAGRITCGLVSDLKVVNTTVEQNVSLVIAGVITVVSSLLIDTRTVLISYDVIFGLSQGFFNSLRMIMLVNLLGIQRINSSLGLSSLFQGIPLMLGPTLIGSISGKQCMIHGHASSDGDMDNMFLATGIIMIISAAVCFPLNCVNRRERKKALEQAVLRNE